MLHPAPRWASIMPHVPMPSTIRRASLPDHGDRALSPPTAPERLCGSTRVDPARVGGVRATRSPTPTPRGGTAFGLRPPAPSSSSLLGSSRQLRPTVTRCAPTPQTTRQHWDTPIQVPPRHGIGQERTEIGNPGHPLWCIDLNRAQLQRSGRGRLRYPVHHPNVGWTVPGPCPEAGAARGPCGSASGTTALSKGARRTPVSQQPLRDRRGSSEARARTPRTRLSRDPTRSVTGSGESA